MAQTNDVLVVGGGLIGLTIAYRLSSKGLSVTLFDRGDQGQASPTAGGLLSSPIHERSTEDAFFELCLAGRRLYPELALELRSVTGVDIELLQWGALEIFGSESHRDDWHAKAAELKKRRVAVELLDERQIHALEPALSPAHWGGALLSDEHHLNNEELLAALRLACDKRGVIRKSGCEVLSLLRAGDDILGVETGEGLYLGGHTICAGGAWSSQLLRPLGLNIPIQPIRGQILALKSNISLHHILYGQEGYMIPRLGGELLIGSTVEDVGFGVANTVSAMGHFCKAATTFAPQLQSAEISRMWSGLRPRTPDGKPVIGPTSRFRRLLIAAGHYRDGILLAPMTAHILTEILVNGQSPVALAPFSPDRFGA